MKKFLEKYLSPIVIIFVVGLTLLPLLRPGLPDVHDPTSAFRLYTLVDSIKDGQFPAAWNNSLNFGFGYPLHLYYAPLFSYGSALVFFIVQNFEIAIKISILFASLLGSFGVYKYLLGSGQPIALLSSLAFTLLPYRASAIYVRGSYAEFLAMSLLPWIVLLWSSPINSKKRIALAVLTTSAFFLSHNTLFLILPPLLFLLIVLYQKSFLKNVLITLFLSVGLSAWSLFPVIFERNFVQAQAIALQTNYQDHFVTLRQLWYSPWGYGGSSLGESDLMSFMLGKGQLVLALLAAIYFIYHKKYKLLLIPLFLSIFYIYFTQSWSVQFWQYIPFFPALQFPWRLLSYATIGISILAGYSLNFFTAKHRNLVCIFALILLIKTNIGYFMPWNLLNYNASILSDINNLHPLVSQKIPEYLPATMSKFPTYSVDDGLQRTPTRITGKITRVNSAPLLILTAYMPQWQLRINNVVTPIIATSEGYIQTKNDLAPGESKIELVWSRTPIENIGLIISAISLLVVIGLWLL